MKWYWKVRIYNTHGAYRYSAITTGQDLKEIDTIQDAYLALTGCKMLLEGMSRTPYDVSDIQEAFRGLWEARLEPKEIA